jgi:c-di-GMP-binding flagellar brake protein YcgR
MDLPENQPERRGAKRMSVALELQYRLLNKRNGNTEGIGQTLNMSSSGVLFTTSQTLQPGRRLEVAITWPAQLNAQCGLKLVARGRVVRLVGNSAALEMIRHEFRTKGAPRA